MRTPQDLIQELSGAGVRQKEIVDMTGISSPYVSQLKSGRSVELSYQKYAALVDCHRRLMKRAKKIAAIVAAEV